MSAAGYSLDKLRGAFRAGYDQGFKDGRESLYKRRWKKPTSAEDIKEGDEIKLLVPTFMDGWKGWGIVTEVRGEVVQFNKDGIDSRGHLSFENTSIQARWFEMLYRERKDSEGQEGADGGGGRFSPLRAAPR